MDFDIRNYKHTLLFSDADPNDYLPGGLSCSLDGSNWFITLSVTRASKFCYRIEYLALSDMTVHTITVDV